MGYHIQITVYEADRSYKMSDEGITDRDLRVFRTKYGVKRMYSEIQALIGDVISTIEWEEENGHSVELGCLNGPCDEVHGEETEEEKTEDEAASAEAYADEMKDSLAEAGKLQHGAKSLLKEAEEHLADIRAKIRTMERGGTDGA